ncbi:hypothetical protein FC756_27005 [Lysinibacillus mangiferihumi]|uniref:Uncharacterized protein n=1 Tax=Lysinibacillus mangiferihumi TaxID=1130819 RepID=A0A4U2XZC7_9BACI|nr:hypothetical protein [Lysinibacillus mangiferihumi]TKI52845.1 hypothetical protein FC756_27005 [Lysinibacillus mangiferihumi]
MDINRIKQIDRKIDEMHQTLGDSPNAMVNFQAVYNDMKYLIMMALDGQKEANKLRTKIGRMKITIKKKDHVIRTIDHHNNRLGNDNRAKTTVLEKFREENKRLREALESAQSQLISIRGLDKVHDSEITGICAEIRKTLEGGEIK